MEGNMLADKIEVEVAREPGMTDRRLSEVMFGTSARRSQINSECNFMARCGRIIRQKREDGLIGNFPIRRKPTLTLV
jgi:hypothetical protein